MKYEKHNQRNTRLYKIWVSMKQRCYNEKDINYPKYGERGIKVCKLWKNSFIEFSNWAKINGYEENLSIDRINNDSNYSPDNCRWTTRQVQGRNTRRLYKHNTSGYRGVSFSLKRNSFQSTITIDCKMKHIGYFKDKKDAVKAYDDFVIANDLEHTINIKDGNYGSVI